MNTTLIRHALTTVTGALLLAAGAVAQEDTGLDGVPWMQAEVIVFRQLDTSSAADEQWPAHPQLAYPSAIEILRDPTAIPATTPSPTQPPVAAAQPPVAPPTAGDAAAGGTPQPPREEPFLLLAPDTFLLRDAAARLNAAAGYRVLTHIAWRQPLPRGNSGSNILVTGGDARDGHFELEGYLSLRREHFLHLDTNLWLNDFATPGATNPVPDTGVELPALPQPPAPVVPAIDPQTGLAPAAGAAPAPAITTPTVGNVAPAADGGTDAAALSAETALPPAPVRTLRTVVLQSTRRLRLGEIHYVDHPLFGVIVSLRAYDPDAAAAAAVNPDVATGSVPGSITPAATASP